MPGTQLLGGLDGVPLGGFRRPLRRLLGGFQADETWVLGSVDTTTFYRGTQARRLTSTNGASAYASRTFSPTTTFAGEIDLAMYVDNLENVSEIYVEIYTDGSKAWKSWVYNYSWMPSAGGNGHQLTSAAWNVVRIRPPQSMLVGGPPATIGDYPWYKIGGTPAAWGTSVYLLRVTLKSKAGTTANLTIGEWVAAQRKKGYVTIGFDGPRREGLIEGPANAINDLNSRGWPGVLWCHVANLVADDDPDYLRVAEVLELQDNHGWDISSHGWTGISLTGKTESEIREEWEGAKAGLASIGVHANMGLRWNSLLGNGSSDLVVALSPEYWTGTRAGSAVTGITFNDYGATFDTIPPRLWHQFCYIYGPWMEYQQIGGAGISIGAVLDRVAAGGLWMDWFTHRIQTSPTGGPLQEHSSVAWWNAFLAALDARVAAGTIEVVSPSGLYDRIARGLV